MLPIHFDITPIKNSIDFKTRGGGKYTGIPLKTIETGYLERRKMFVYELWTMQNKEM